MGMFEGTPWDRPPHCPVCDELEEECICPPPEKQVHSPPGQVVRLAVEKRKRGKVVTVIRGLPSEKNDLPGLLTSLKNQCGSGGTLKDEMIELQGDQLERSRQYLATLGYTVK